MATHSTKARAIERACVYPGGSESAFVDKAVSLLKRRKVDVTVSNYPFPDEQQIASSNFDLFAFDSSGTNQSGMSTLKALLAMVSNDRTPVVGLGALEIIEANLRNKTLEPNALDLLIGRAFQLALKYSDLEGVTQQWADSHTTSETAELTFPLKLKIPAQFRQTLRYGENPHQRAAFYALEGQQHGISTATQIQGKELSYNNINDTSAAFELASEFDPAISAAVVIVKHANPCGVAIGRSLSEAYEKALACDPVSAFGGIVACNRPIDAELASRTTKIFTEVVIAPDADAEARAILRRKSNVRLLLTGELFDPRAQGFELKTVRGGLLIQTRDNACVDDMKLHVKSNRQPTDRELADLRFAFKVAKHVKSNAIVYAKDGATVGIGAGQSSRIDAAKIAALKAEEAARAVNSRSRAEGAVVASDAFFPFADGLEAAAQAGITAVIQPGGSMRDDDVIRAANDRGLAMVFTDVRHFRH
jgi:AICAR transformylase/IMP cyclohydrolase PurH